MSNNFTDEQLDQMNQRQIEKITAMSNSQLFYTVCNLDDPKKIRKFIEEHELSQIDYYYGLYYACKNQYMDIDTIELISSKNVKNWDQVFIHACECVNQEIFEYLVKKCVEKYNTLNWDFGFYTTCRIGKTQIVKSIISKMSERNVKIDWNEGLHNAYIGKNPEIVDLMISKGADICLRRIYSQDLFVDITSLMLNMVPKYKEYKRTQVLKYTKMHESLIDFVSIKFKEF